MIILDTNVVSELGKPRPSAVVIRWFATMEPARLFLNEITVMELAYGAERHLLKHGSNRYHQSLTRLIEVQFENRIAGLLKGADRMAGYIRARSEMSGRMMGVQDAMIAAICLSHGATLATRNIRDFEGLDLPLANPFEER